MRSINSKKHWHTFVRPYFSRPRLHLQHKKVLQHPKKNKKSTMADPTPWPCSPNIVPHNVTQNFPFDGINIDTLPFVPEVSFGDWTAAAADTKAIVTMSGCDKDCLKACIVTVLAYIWGIQDMFPAQLDAVSWLLLPIHQNHLAVIQWTGAGKTHIL